MSQARTKTSEALASPNTTPKQGRLAPLLDMLSREDDWLIMINADPDALGAAMALRRILSRRVGEVSIASINTIARPDNMAMVRYLRIPLIPWDSSLSGLFTRFAIVDSQPHHSPAFEGVPFSIVVDHHPLVSEHPVNAPYVDIRPDRGATCSIFADYLRALHIRPGALLATAMQYGIRTDTRAFTRGGALADMRAYQSLARFADATLLTRIMHSEYLPEWLKYFSRAFSSLHVRKGGGMAFVDVVENPDILVVVADFFTRVHGLTWIAVGGVYDSKVVCIFRGDGRRDMGAFAAERFADLGTAGGHKTMARAEFLLTAANGRNVEVLLYKRLFERKAVCQPVGADQP